MIRILFQTALVLARMLPFAAASAQTEVSGTIRGKLDGGERAWSALDIDIDEGNRSYASWIEPMNVTAYQIDSQTHPSEDFTVASTLTPDLLHLELPSDCPCRGFTTEAHFSTSSMVDEFHLDRRASATITEFELPKGEGYCIPEMFLALVTYRESAASEPDPEWPLAVEGSYEIAQEVWWG